MCFKGGVILYICIDEVIVTQLRVGKESVSFLCVALLWGTMWSYVEAWMYAKVE